MILQYWKELGGMEGEWVIMPFSEAALINPSISAEEGRAYSFVDMQAVDPSRAVLEGFVAIASPFLHQRIADNLRESPTLAAIRDALLPKFLSGEVFIKDSEKFLGSAV